jgi:uncharacterized BrkB/YihY/UPF0761 family membrane protein
LTSTKTPSQPTAEDGRGTGRIESVRERAREVPIRLNAARSQHSSVDACFELFERDRRLASSVLAGGIAFRLFFWLLPFALVLGGVLGFSSSGSADEAAQHLGLTGTAANAIAESVQAADKGRWALLLIGGGALLWTSSWSVVALRRVYALIWNVPPPRSANPLKAALAFSGVLILLLAIPTGAARLRDISPGPGLVVVLLAVGAFFGIWLWVSTWLPHGDAPLTALIPGALLAAVGAQFVHLFTVLYIAAKLERASALYGGLGLAATFLFVLYIAGRLVISSAVVNAELWRRGGVTADSESRSPG